VRQTLGRTHLADLNAPLLSSNGEFTSKANVKKHPERAETEHRPIGKKPKKK